MSDEPRIRRRVRVVRHRVDADDWIVPAYLVKLIERLVTERDAARADLERVRARRLRWIGGPSGWGRKLSPARADELENEGGMHGTGT